MSYCCLTEVKTLGRHYTRNNKQDGGDKVFSRIDRVLANPKWHTMFDSAEAAYLPEAEFNHSPMVMNCYKCIARGNPSYFTICGLILQHTLP